jgi:nicotinamide mononucleotide (NMN) deamidase PncC
MPTRAVIITTGGGTGVFEQLTHRGGGSATLIEGRVPYSESQSIKLMGGRPDKLVSAEATRKLAMAAFEMAVAERVGDEPVVGLACSSILQRTPTEREGRVHYIYCALQTATKTISTTLVINDAKAIARSSTAELIRVFEERINVEMLLNLLAEGCGLSDSISHDHIHRVPGVTFSRQESTLQHPNLASLLYRNVHKIGFQLHQSGGKNILTPYDDSVASLILPGSFNPMHDAHLYMMQNADPSCSCDLEFSIQNVDKPNIDLIDLEKRILSVFDCAKPTASDPVRIWVTNMPTFVEKAQHFPLGTTFVVGMDTAKRIVDPKYAGPYSAVDDVFQERITSFIVFTRDVDDENQITTTGRGFPIEFLDRIVRVKDQEPHLIGMSSTAIRNARK